MKDEMAAANLPEPAFGLEGFFTVTFYRPLGFERWLDTWQPLLTAWTTKVLRAINENASITKPQLAKLIGQSRASVDKHISQLRNMGILKRVGSNKTGKWILNKIPPPDNS